MQSFDTNTAKTDEPQVASLYAALDRLRSVDALVLPMVTERECANLLDEAAALPFERTEPVVGKGDRLVRQNLEHCEASPGGMAAQTAEHVAEQINHALRQFQQPPCPPMTFNALALQRYGAGGGITPHRDSLRYRYLVAVLVLAGDGCFEICSDRAGTACQHIPAPPGHLILMRAPGFAGSDHRPFHRLSGICQGRTSLGMRYNVYG